MHLYLGVAISCLGLRVGASKSGMLARIPSGGYSSKAKGRARAACPRRCRLERFRV